MKTKWIFILVLFICMQTTNALTQVRIAPPDSVIIGNNKISVNNVVNGANGFVTKSSVKDSVDAALARNDSSNYTDGSFAIADVNQLNERLTEKLLKTTFAESLYANLGKNFSVGIPDYCDTTVNVADSVKVLARFDIDAPWGQKKKLIAWGLGVDPDSTFWGATFIPRILYPDSIRWYAKTTDKDSSSYSVEVYDPAGSIVYSSGNVTFAADNTWEYHSDPFTEFAAGFEEHAVVYRIRVCNPYQLIEIGQVYFKKN